ncbi:DUF5675 family protein [Photobacterium arenosum]|uniref:DUF5675 family protein n=1 Tax=Photobacterium arenosum TaxID=2774143 RepID=UPI0028890F9D|nr:DUF5675 family protein [Photobacterium arenosum]
MKTLTLRRRHFSHGVFSTLHDDSGHPICDVIERPWLNNQPRVSCIPEGTYDLLPHNSPRFGECYALEMPSLGVTRYGPSQRTHILIHPANTVSELEGCLAPGSEFGVVNGQWGVLDSRAAFTVLMDYLDGEDARLEIVKD